MRLLPNREIGVSDVLDAHVRVASIRRRDTTLKCIGICVVTLVLSGAALDLVSGKWAMLALLLVAVAMVAIRRQDNLGERPGFTVLALIGALIMAAALFLDKPGVSLFAAIVSGGVWLILSRFNH